MKNISYRNIEAYPSISVAILTWNRKQHVLKAIESVYRQTEKVHEIILVDSASTDGTKYEVHKKFPKVKIISLHENLGCPGGRNIAYSNCEGDIIFSLDDDAYLEKNTIEHCVNLLMTDNKIGVIACSIVDQKKKNKPSKFKNNYVSIFSGGACAIRKEALTAAGYYPSYFFRQGEETDLSIRLLECGFFIVHCADAIVYHDKSDTNRDSKLFAFYSLRNDLYTIVRLYPFFMIIPSVIYKIFKWNKYGIKNNSFHYTISAVFLSIFKLPKLFLSRKPVSINTINTFIKFSNNQLHSKLSKILSNLFF
jgi:GT2 family glycosyltransferase